MGHPASALRPEPLTVEDWLATGPAEHFELQDGSLVRKAVPSAEHGDAQLGLGSALRSAFHRKSEPGGLGGWWILGEVDLKLGKNGFRPDLVGWRRDRVPQMPRGSPVDVVPDWIFEVVSDSNASNDLVYKRRRYAEAGIAHYWIADPRDKSLVVHRLVPEGYLIALAATAGETVRAEPFGAIELVVGTLFGEEPDDAPATTPVPDDEPQDG